MPVRVPSDHRFRRARTPARRRSRAAVVLAVAWAMTLLAGAGLLAAALLGRFASGPLLTVRHVEVEGLEHLERAEVDALLTNLPGQNLITIDLGELTDRLESSPWIRVADIRRVLPATVAIDVRERRPVALARIDDRLHLIDAWGTLIAEYGPRYVEFDLPIVDGLVGEDGSVDHARMQLARDLIEALAGEADLLPRVSQVDVSDEMNAIVILEGEPVLLHLGSEDFVERLDRYLDLAPTLEERVPVMDYIDLRFGERIYVGTMVAVAQGDGPVSP